MKELIQSTIDAALKENPQKGMDFLEKMAKGRDEDPLYAHLNGLTQKELISIGRAMIKGRAGEEEFAELTDSLMENKTHLMTYILEKRSKLVECLEKYMQKNNL